MVPPRAALAEAFWRERSSKILHDAPCLVWVLIGLASPQGSNPVQVSVGLYDTAYEAQRAAEAYAPPIWQEPKKNST